MDKKINLNVNNDKIELDLENINNEEELNKLNNEISKYNNVTFNIED